MTTIVGKAPEGSRKVAESCGDMKSADRRRESWRAAQKARRERMRTSGRVLVRLNLSPEEADRLIANLKQMRRAARIEMLRAQAPVASPAVPAGTSSDDDGDQCSLLPESEARDLRDRRRKLRVMLRKSRGRHQ